MRNPWVLIFALVCSLSLGLSPSAAHADFTKTIQAIPGTPVQAVATFYYASCTQSLGVGSYSVNVAPKYGTLSFSTVSGPLPGCPADGPSLPAAAAFYTSTAGQEDYFQLTFSVNGGGSEVIDITVNSTSPPVNPQPPPVNPPPADSLAITTTALPNTISGDPYNPFQLMSSGGEGPVTWTASGNLPEGFSLSRDGLLSNSGTPPPLAAAGTYSITFTATDSKTSVSTTLPLIVSTENCAENAIVHFDKIDVCTISSGLGKINACKTSITAAQVGNVLYFTPGYYLYNQGNKSPFQPAYVVAGMLIHNDPDPVTYPSTGIPASDIQFVYVQTLDKWYGDSVYRGPYNIVDERGARPYPAAMDDFPQADDPPPGGQTPIYYGDGTHIFDAPQVSAPLQDSSGRLLVGVHYTKKFTAYLGCHTHRDELDFGPEDARHYIRTLATVQWSVNFDGSILRSCSGPFNGFGCSYSFVPNPNPVSGAGVHYDPPISSHDEPPVTRKANAPYEPFPGLGHP